MVTAKMYHIVIVHVTAITEYLCSGDMIRMCYFNSSTRYRQTARFDSSDIDFSLCTHYIYAFGGIDTSYYTISPMDPRREIGPSGVYRDFNTRDVAKNSRRLLSIGGPNVTAHNAFVSMTQSDDNIRAFSRHVIDLLRLYGFSGLDIDWQHPTTPLMGAGLVRLLQILREDINNETATDKLLLTVKCPAVHDNTSFYVPNISRYADYVILTAYDLPQSSERGAWFGSPLYSQYVSVSSAIEEWLLEGLPVNKAVVGISAVGRFVKLQNASVFTPGSPTSIDVQLGYYYSIHSGLAYPEICEMMSHGIKYFDRASQMHYLVVRNLWIGYEDKQSIAAKIHWLKWLNISGVMFASIDQDDFKGTFCQQGQYPLLNFIKRESLLPILGPPTRPPTEGTASPQQTGGTTSPLQTTSRFRNGNSLVLSSSRPQPTGGAETTTQTFGDTSDPIAIQTLHVIVTVTLISALFVLSVLAYLCMRRPRTKRSPEE